MDEVTNNSRFKTPEEAMRFTIMRHSYYIYSYGVHVNLYVNDLKVIALDDDPFYVQSSGGASLHFKNGMNKIVFEFIPLSNEAMKQAGKENYLTSEIKAAVSVQQSSYITPDIYLANYHFSIDKERQPRVHVWNKEKGNEKILPNNDEFIAEENQWLADKMQIKSLPNGGLRVTIEAESKEVTNPHWVNAVPYNGNNNEHRKLLEEGYFTYWQLLSNSTIQEASNLRAYYEYYLTDMARFESNKETIFSMVNPVEIAHDDGLELIGGPPLADFSIETNSDGRLVRLTKKMNGTLISPIIYADDDGAPVRTFLPYFSIIDGKAVLTMI